MTEIKDMLIETPIDKFIALVKERKKLQLSEAARILGVDESSVEGWVKILEEREFLEITYPTIGQPTIILKNITSKDVNEKERELSDSKDEVEKKAREIEEKIDESEASIDSTNEKVSTMEKDLRSKLAKLETNLKTLDSLEAKKREIIEDKKVIDAKADETVKSLDSIRSAVNEIDKKIEDKIKLIESHSMQIKELEKMRLEVRGEIEELEAEFKLTKMVFRGTKTPLLKSLKSLFDRHDKKVKKIKNRHSMISKKVDGIRTKAQKSKKKALDKIEAASE